MQVPRIFAAIVVGLVLMAAPAAADVRLTINGGRVSLSAKNATVSQILAEWAKVGQTKIINGERIPGGPLTLELTDVSEVEAIEIVLRSAGGYLLAPRSTNAVNTSRFDRILIIPTSNPVRPTVAPPPAPAPVFRQPQFTQPAAPPDDNDEPADRPNGQNPAVQNPRPPVFNPFPQPLQRTSPPPPAAPTSSPSAPAGVSVPGMVVPSPTQGQPAAPGTPQ